MSYQNQPSSTPLTSQPEAQTESSKPRFARVRAWLRSRTGRVVIPIVTLLVGIVFGIFTIFLFGESGVGSISIVATPSKGNIIVEADRAFLTQLVTKNLSSTGMPGQIENVDVSLAEGNQMTVSGDDRISIFGVGITRQFAFVVQPYVSSCVLQMHIVHADFSNIPVTSFAQVFEGQINQQLQKKPEGLPEGFQYCSTGVRTESAGMFVTYKATPI
jgi:hypothetical protein